MNMVLTLLRNDSSICLLPPSDNMRRIKFLIFSAVWLLSFSILQSEVKAFSLFPKQAPNPVSVPAAKPFISPAVWGQNLNDIFNLNSGRVWIGPMTPPLGKLVVSTESGAAVFAQNRDGAASAITGVNLFGYGISGLSHGQGKAGVYGNNDHVQGGYGVYGYNEGFGGGTGVMGEGPSFNSNGVYGKSISGTGVKGESIAGWAGYFLGKTYVSGNVGIGTTNPTALSLGTTSGTNLTISDTANWANLNLRAPESMTITFDDINAPVDTKIGALVYRDQTLKYISLGERGAMRNDNILVLRGDSGNVGVGVANPGAKLEVNGGLKLGSSVGSKPTCNDSNRGILWFSKGQGEASDVLEVCIKTGTPSAQWRQI